MNKWITLAIGLVIFTGCKKDEEEKVATTGTVKTTITNKVGTQPITMGIMQYTNAAGELYSVDMLKYYLGHLTLVADNGHLHELKDHHLVDQNNSATHTIDVSGIPNGTYTSLRFNVGIEESHNHSGAQNGDLDPINGMLWTWNTGYIFFKHEGQFVPLDAPETTLIYHYGTDQAFLSIELPINLKVEGDANEVHLDFDLDKLYSVNGVIQFTGNAVHQSTSASDIPWLAAMRANFFDSFTVHAE